MRDIIFREFRYWFFGLIHAMSSGLGQTFFMGLLVAPLCLDYNMNATEYGGYYGLITLMSACILPFTGSLVDRVHAKSMSFAAIFLIFIGYSLIYFRIDFWGLMLAVFLIRHFGQAILPLIGSTLIAKKYSTERGRVLALTGIGFAISEFVFPLSLGTLMKELSWLSALAIVAGVAAVVHGFAVYFIVDRNDSFCQPTVTRVDRQKLHWFRTFQSVMKVRFTYLSIPAMTAAPGILTGIIFHQSTLAVIRSWDVYYVAASFSVFAILRVIGSFVGGFLVDRFTAKWTLLIHLIPLALGIWILQLASDQWAIGVIWGIFGLCVGIGGNVKQAIWAEIYSKKNLGSVKAIIHPVTIFSTALTPFLFGQVIEWASVGVLLTSCLGFVGLSAVMLLVGLTYFHPPNPIQESML